MQATGLADPVPAAAVLAEPTQGNGRAGGEKQDYGAYEIMRKGHKRHVEEPADAPLATDGRGNGPAAGPVGTREDGMAPDLAVVRARAVWLEVTKGVRGSATALMERLDALTDPERTEDAAMLAGWRAKYENEITERMKSTWWRRMGRKREVG